MGQPPHIWFVYAQPAPALRDYVSGYHFVEVAPGEAGTIRDFNYPAWTLLRFTLGGRPWRAQVGGAWADVPSAALFGVTSRATPFASEGGLMVGPR
jgi:hypothetical protein